MSSRTTHTDARAGTPARDLPEPSLRNTVIAGFVTVAIAFGGFIGWSSVAALESAAIAPGVVIANSHRKTVQHLEGGILRELLVKEGDQVKAGQVLMRLDSLQA
ncbi:MAG TPA: biotin/lipoyl-binding protein, partial [Vicinamibacterales bacterium]